MFDMADPKVELSSLGKRSEFPGIFDHRRTLECLMEAFIERGDDHAFEELFIKTYRPLCRFCQRFVQVPEVAEELVSDVLCALWINRGRIAVTSYRSYLYTAARNKCLDYLRKVRRASWYDLEAASHMPVEHSDTEQVLAGRELDVTIRKSVAALPRRCRVIFELSRQEGLKHREIAAQLNISVKTVETQIGRALKHLHQSIATDL